MLAELFLTVLSATLCGASAPPAHEVAAVKARLAPLQLLSFATDLEYCGYLGRDPDGGPVFTEMVRGGHYGCTPVLPGDDVTLIASVHTHGAYSPEIPSEFPTALDIASDAAEGIDGYVATPGGRLWFIDGRARIALQLCGPGCLPQDPQFHEGDDGPVAARYSHRTLIGLESPQ